MSDQESPKFTGEGRFGFREERRGERGLEDLLASYKSKRDTDQLHSDLSKNDPEQKILPNEKYRLNPNKEPKQLEKQSRYDFTELDIQKVLDKQREDEVQVRTEFNSFVLKMQTTTTLRPRRIAQIVISEAFDMLTDKVKNIIKK